MSDATSKVLEPAVEFIHVSMRFGAFWALRDVNLWLAPNRFHVLLGENGAGKSTLVKCLIGYQRPTEGQIVVDGREAQFSNPHEAHRLGLGMVYQQFTLADNLTVAENIVLSLEPMPPLIAWTKEIERIEAFLKTMPFRVPLETLVSGLSAGEKQKLEILMQLYRRRRILILDEPSSVLTPGEADEVLGMLKDLVRQKKLTVILITHKFRELFAYGDTVAVLRRGELVGSGEVADFSQEDLSRLMLGHNVESKAASPDDILAPAPRALESAGPALVVDGPRLVDERGRVVLDNCRLSVNRGEIYGIAGVSGNGQKELVEIFMGLHPKLRAAVHIDGRPFVPTVAAIAALGLAVIPELPLRNASVAAMSIWENLAFRCQSAYRPEALRAAAADLQTQFGIRASSLRAPIRSLSGGNVQRTVLARELSAEIRFLVVANPCFGLDFQASSEIRQRLRQARDQGAAVLLVSEDLDEVLSLADRIGVMFDGRIIYEAARQSIDVTRIGQAMAGIVDAS